MTPRRSVFLRVGSSQGPTGDWSSSARPNLSGDDTAAILGIREVVDTGRALTSDTKPHLLPIWERCPVD